MARYLFAALIAAVSCCKASEATRHSRRRLRLNRRQDSPTRIREFKLDCTSHKDNPCEGADAYALLPLFPDCQHYIQCVPHALELFRCNAGEIFDYEKQGCSARDEGTCICEQSPPKWVDIRKALDPDASAGDQADSKAFKKASTKTSKSAKSKGAKTLAIDEESKGGVSGSGDSWISIGSKSPSSTPTTLTTNSEPTSTPTPEDCFAAPGESSFEDGIFPESPWSTSGDGNWTIDEGDTYQGLYSIKSPDFEGSPSKKTSRVTFSTW